MASSGSELARRTETELAPGLKRDSVERERAQVLFDERQSGQPHGHAAHQPALHDTTRAVRGAAALDREPERSSAARAHARARGTRVEHDPQRIRIAEPPAHTNVVPVKVERELGDPGRRRELEPRGGRGETGFEQGERDREKQERAAHVPGWTADDGPGLGPARPSPARRPRSAQSRTPAGSRPRGLSFAPLPTSVVVVVVVAVTATMTAAALTTQMAAAIVIVVAHHDHRAPVTTRVVRD